MLVVVFVADQCALIYTLTAEVLQRSGLSLMQMQEQDKETCTRLIHHITAGDQDNKIGKTTDNGQSKGSS